MFRIKNRPEPAPELERALAAWKADEALPETLSDAARRAILAEASRPAKAPRRLEGFADLFVPARRIALAAALPTLLLAVVLVAGLPGFRPGTEAPKQIEARKSGGEVVFLIANGKTVHRVVRTTRPDSGSGDVFTTTDGRYEDRLESEATLVFYRFE